MFVSLGHRFEKFHEHEEQKKNRIISVTNFITFLGYGYESRNSLFFPSPQRENRYKDLCLAHGKKYEERCKEFLRRKLEGEYRIIDTNNISIYCRDLRLIGTPDAFLVDEETGELGILEIKCPFGTQYGQFDEEAMPEKLYASQWEKWPEKHFKHWLQLQLYLYITREWRTTFGLVAYYYPSAGPNGEAVCYMYKVIPSELDIRAQLHSYFSDYCKRSEPVRERITGRLSREEQARLLIRKTQRVRLQG